MTEAAAARPIRSLSRSDWLGYCLVAAALALLAFRLTQLELAPFIGDEAQFLLAAHTQNATGVWPRASTLVGTQGFAYGPFPIWFYALAQQLVGPRPSACIAVMCALMTFTAAVFAYAVNRSLCGSPARLALSLAVLAASPYQFFWSRVAWDCLVDVCSAWIVALLVWSDTLSWPRRLGLGFVIGAALASHLMVAPLVLLVGFVLLVEHRGAAHSGKVLAFVGPVIAVAALVVAPYCSYLAGLLNNPPASIGQPIVGGVATSYWSRLAELPRVSSLLGLQYFMDDDFSRLAERLRPLPLVPMQYVSFGLWSAIAIAGITAGVLQWQRLSLGVRRGLGLAVAVIVVYPAFYWLRDLRVEPHYQFPTSWVIPFGALLAVELLPWRLARQGTATLLVALAVVQSVVVVDWMALIRAQGGGSGAFHYRTSVGVQERAMQSLCKQAPQAFRLASSAMQLPITLIYLLQTEPACQDKRVEVCTRCKASASEPLFVLRYPAPGNFGLEVVRWR